MSVLDRLSPDDRRLLRPQAPPDFVEPMLATLHREPFTDQNWVFERKLDGVRALASRAGEAVRLRSRTRREFSRTYPEIVEALADQAAGTFVVDGEIVAVDGDTTSFSRLQGRIGISDPDRARRSGIAVHLYVFDLMHVDGHDITALPLRTRKSLSQELFTFAGDDRIRFSAHRDTDGEEQLAQACAHGWEGLYDDEQLVYSGKVGTGFDTETLVTLEERLRSIERSTPPFDRGALPRKGVHWVRPELVAEIVFTEWTNGDRLRHPRFLGLRPDKAATDVVKEVAA